jgi:N-acetylglucosamine-6-phosphate deacetylase
MDFALTGARIFDGESFHENASVIVADDRIAGLSPVESLPAGLEIRRLSGGLLAPGFIDIQVNGGGGVLFNESPSAEGILAIANAHRRFGTTGLLPTVITDAPQITRTAIDAVRDLRAHGNTQVLGIHVEGPFLDPRRKGAHAEQFIRTMDDRDVHDLVKAECGALLLTVAPNSTPPALIRKLVEGGVLVSLGHAEATYSETRAALDAGATGFTHLFNAMSQLTGREPGMVGAALSDTSSFIGIIADGLHVDDVSMKLAVSSTSLSRFMLITDAMPTAAGGPESFDLQGRRAQRVGDRLELADGTLAGSILTMDQALRNAVHRLQVPLHQSLQMASRNPARFIRRNDLGVIKTGALASLVHLDEELNVLETWIEGR